MFRVAQADPQTGVIHLNTDAISRYEHHQLLSATLGKVLDGGLKHGLDWVCQLEDESEVVQALKILVPLIHEIRHHVDLLLTPSGFNRIRAFFELMNNAVPLMGRVGRIPIPLHSACDPTNQEILGLRLDEISAWGEVAEMFKVHSHAYSKENFIEDLGDNVKFGFGSNQIFEALAYNMQTETLNNFFYSEQVISEFPRFFAHTANENNGWLEFKSKYGWIPAIAMQLGGGGDAARMALCIAFASTCGASQFRELQPGTELIGVYRPLTHNRFVRLFEYFKGKKLPEESWEESWALVDSQVEKFWGKNVESEIEEDIEFTETYFSEALPQLFETTIDEPEGFHYQFFRDQIESRKQYFQIFKENPTWLVSPTSFIFHLSKRLKPIIVSDHPRGVSKLIRQEGWKQRPDRYYFNEKTYELNDAKKDQVFYSEFLGDEGDSGVSVPSPQNYQSWANYLGHFVPITKLLIYGLRVETIVKADLGFAMTEISKFCEIVWDPIYKNKNVVRSSEEFFEYFGIDEADCDLCSRKIDKKNLRFVAREALKSQQRFVRDYFDKHGSIPTYGNLVVDWSDWLLCRKCIVKWNVEQRSGLSKLLAQIGH